MVETAIRSSEGPARDDYDDNDDDDDDDEPRPPSQRRVASASQNLLAHPTPRRPYGLT